MSEPRTVTGPPWTVDGRWVVVKDGNGIMFDPVLVFPELADDPDEQLADCRRYIDRSRRRAELIVMLDEAIKIAVRLAEKYPGVALSLASLERVKAMVLDEYGDVSDEARELNTDEVMRRVFPLAAYERWQQNFADVGKTP